jgi:hypothetical protein
MRRAAGVLTYSAIRVEGGLLPAEFLQSIGNFAAKHQAATDYGLPASLHLRDEIAHLWRRASALWTDFNDRRQRQDLDAGTVTVKDWLVPLLRDVLGYHDIEERPPAMIGERQFPVRRFAHHRAVPIVLAAATFNLDTAHAQFGEEGRRRSPFGLLQEFLNAEQACLWGIASNGLRLRLARDNPSLTRPAFLEIDLERIFQEKLYSDFAPFWLMAHASRLAPQQESPYQCIIEGWRNQGIETGERVRERLRHGVTEALRQLGSGLLEHPVCRFPREGDQIAVGRRRDITSRHLDAGTPDSTAWANRCERRQPGPSNPLQISDSDHFCFG